MYHLVLYTTLGCHLCDQATTIIENSQFNSDISLTLSEISEHEELLIKYGERIPVVKFTTSDREISWPFDGQQFDNWLMTGLA